MKAQPIKQELQTQQAQTMLATIHELIRSESKKGFLKAIMKKWCDENKHNIKIKPGFDTACWVFHNNQHHIYLGDAMFNAVMEDADGAEYVHAMLYHEMSHALWTSRDMDEINALLQNKNLPFSLFNLFEDARIEDRWRDLTSLSFNWQQMNKPFEITSPAQCYFAFVFFEGDDSKISWDGDLALVKSFYTRTIQAKNSLQVIHILADWVKEFGGEVEDFPQTGMPSSGKSDDSEGDPQSAESGEDQGAGDDSKQSGGDGSADGGDLQHAVLVAQTGDLGDLEEGTVEIKLIGQSETAGGDEGKNPDRHDSSALNDSDVDFDHDLMCEYPRYIDKQSAVKTAMMIRKIFQTKSVYRASHRASKRLNPRMLSGNKSIPMYKRKEALGRNRIKVNLIVDCSGSMYGPAIENASYIIAVFNQLSLYSVIDCKVILSRECLSSYPVIKLPVSDEIVGRIGDASAGVGEGLEQCFKTHLKEMAEANFNFIITDGELTDGDIRKSYYQSRGIFTIGMYANPNLSGEDLLKWFDVGIVRSDLGSLFSSLVSKMRNT